LSREIQKLVPYDRLAINLLEKDEIYVRVYAEESRLPASAIPEGLSVREGTATGWVLDHKEPLICRDVLKDPRFPLTHKRYKNVGLRSYVILPLMVKGKTLGALNLGSLKPRCYGKKEIKILSPIAEILSLAVENSNLYQESERREEIQKLLKELSQDITSLAIDSLLKKLTEKVREVFKVDVCEVRVLKGDKWSLMGISGVDPNLVPFSLDVTVYGRLEWIIENRRPLMIPDSIQEGSLPPGETVKALGVRGYLGVPLFSRGGEVIGVLRALTYQPREFAQKEVDLIQQLANGAAVAIENARLFEELQKKSQEVEEAYRTKSEFLNTMAHELRTPLNVLIATMQLFRDGFYGALSEKHITGFEPMERNARNLLDLISGILELARLEAKRVPLQIEEFLFKEIIDEFESSFMPLVREKGLELRFRLDDPMIKLKTDKSKIKAIIQNLLGNAVKYTDSGEIEVRVSAFLDGQASGSQGKSLSILVRDTGIGIKESDLPHIFQAFYLAEGVNRRKYPGSGLGLCIVERLLEMLGGNIQAQSEWGKGSTFTVTLPLIHPSGLQGGLSQRPNEEG